MANHARPTTTRLPRLVAAVRAFGLAGLLALLIAVNIVLAVILATLREVTMPLFSVVFGGLLVEALIITWRWADPYARERRKRT